MSRHPEDKCRYDEAARKLKDQIKRLKKKHSRHTFKAKRQQLTPTVHSRKQPND
jgi:hypothetical protein